MGKNSEANMSTATRHFTKKAAEKEANMPLAIQHFTVKDRKVKDKKKAEIQAMHDTPHEMAPGQAYFTKQSNAEKEKRAAGDRGAEEEPAGGEHGGAALREDQREEKGRDEGAC